MKGQNAGKFKKMGLHGSLDLGVRCGIYNVLIR